MGHLSKPKKGKGHKKDKSSNGEGSASNSVGDTGDTHGANSSGDGGQSARLVRGQYFADGPPKLTLRQAELYGLVPYEYAAALLHHKVTDCTNPGSGSNVGSNGSESDRSGVDAALLHPAQQSAETAMAKGVRFRESERLSLSF